MFKERKLKGTIVVRTRFLYPLCLAWLALSVRPSVFLYEADLCRNTYRIDFKIYAYIKHAKVNAGFKDEHHTKVR